MKVSKHKQMILDVIIDNPIHPTADFIYKYLKKDNPNLSLATVYRNLIKLEDNGDIQKINLPGHPDRFETNTKPHQHFICNTCQNIIDINSETLNNLKRKLSKEIGLEIVSSNFIFNGICDNCKK